MERHTEESEKPERSCELQMNNQNFLSKLPLELKRQIAAFLDWDSLFVLAKTCSQLAFDFDSDLWEISITRIDLNTWCTRIEMPYCDFHHGPSMHILNWAEHLHSYQTELCDGKAANNFRYLCNCSSSRDETYVNPFWDKDYYKPRSPRLSHEIDHIIHGSGFPVDPFALWRVRNIAIDIEVLARWYDHVKGSDLVISAKSYEERPWAVSDIPSLIETVSNFVKKLFPSLVHLRIFHAKIHSFWYAFEHGTLRAVDSDPQHSNIYQYRNLPDYRGCLMTLYRWDRELRRGMWLDSFLKEHRCLALDGGTQRNYSSPFLDPRDRWWNKSRLRMTAKQMDLHARMSYVHVRKLMSTTDRRSLTLLLRKELSHLEFLPEIMCWKRNSLGATASFGKAENMVRLDTDERFALAERIITIAIARMLELSQSSGSFTQKNV